jgi:hypothetical protein
VIRAASQKPRDHVFKMIAPASALVTKETAMGISSPNWKFVSRRTLIGPR